LEEKEKKKELKIVEVEMEKEDGAPCILSFKGVLAENLRYMGHFGMNLGT